MTGRKIYFVLSLLFFPGCSHGNNDDNKDALRDDTFKVVPPPPKDGSSFSNILSINEDMEDMPFAADIDDYPTLFEGDMIMDANLIYQVRLLKAASEGNVVYEAINHGQWPNAFVPYTYENRYVQNKLARIVNAASLHFAKHTCIKWRYYSPTAIRRFTNYVTFFIGNGCYSHVGMQGSPQKISIGRGCETGGIVVHEMMHALGFYHEQSRQDRDGYIRINWSNIPQHLWYAFEKYRPGTASGLGFEYDKQSIMHYDNYAFAINRRIPTITSLSNSRERFGQRKGLSRTDIAQLNKYYRCRTTTGGKKKKKENKNCKNTYPFCTALSKWCSSNTWVKSNCKKSCNSCSTTVTTIRSKCVNKRQHCDYWKGLGYCRHTYVASMKKYCRKSCRFC